MRDALLYSAGFLGMALSLIHGWLGDSKVIHALTAPHRVTQRINRAVFHLSTIYWFVGGVALLLAPLIGEPFRGPIAWAAAGMYCAGVVANLWATRGRHFGAYALLIVAALAVMGA